MAEFHVQDENLEDIARAVSPLFSLNSIFRSPSGIESPSNFFIENPHGSGTPNLSIHFERDFVAQYAALPIEAKRVVHRNLTRALLRVRGDYDAAVRGGLPAHEAFVTHQGSELFDSVF